MTKQDTFQPTAEQAYKSDRDLFFAKLDTLRRTVCEKTDAAQNRTPKNWGHAGNLGHVNEQLDELISFLS